MTRYHISEPVHLETHHSTHGAIDLSFVVGDYEPRSEQEEEALSHLVAIGFAEVLPAPPAEVAHAPE